MREDEEREGERKRGRERERDIDQGMSQISMRVFWLLFCATACAFIIPPTLPFLLLYIRVCRCYIISCQYCSYHPLLRPLPFATLRFLLLLACPNPYRMIHCTFHSCRRHRRTDAFTLPVLPSHDFAHTHSFVTVIVVVLRAKKLLRPMRTSYASRLHLSRVLIVKELMPCSRSLLLLGFIGLSLCAPPTRLASITKIATESNNC